MERDVVLLETPPTRFRGLDGVDYLKAADGTLFKSGEVAIQLFLIPAVVGEIVLTAEGAGNENS